MRFTARIFFAASLTSHVFGAPAIEERTIGGVVAVGAAVNISNTAITSDFVPTGNFTLRSIEPVKRQPIVLN